MGVLPTELQLFCKQAFSGRNTGCTQHALTRTCTHTHACSMHRVQGHKLCAHIHCIQAEGACAHRMHGDADGV